MRPGFKEKTVGRLFPKLKISGLTVKLTLLIESLVILVVLATGIRATVRESRTLEREISNRGLALAGELSKFTVRPLIGNNLASLRRFVNHTMDQQYVLHVAIFDARGRIVMHSDLAKVGAVSRDPEAEAALASDAPVCFDGRAGTDGRNYCDIFSPVVAGHYRIGTVRLGYSRRAVEKEKATSFRQILMECAATVLIGFVCSLLLARYIAGPVNQITRATRRVADGDLDTVLDIDKNDEIGKLAEAFNRMTSDLRKTTISKEYFDNIIQSMNDTLVVLDEKGRICDANKALCDILAYEKSELVGENVKKIVPDGVPFPEYGKRVDCELDYVTRQGRAVPMLFSAAVLNNRRQGVEGIVGIAHDITQRRAAESALRQSEEMLRLLSSRLMAAQENERRRLSVELHDELGQALVVLKLKTRSLMEMRNEDAAMRVEACRWMISYLDDLTASVRRLSRDLSPSVLKDLGLSVALRHLVKTFADTTGINVRVHLLPLEHLVPVEKHILVYRVVQECLTNIAKHAGADCLSIEAGRGDGHLTVRIKDDGGGFDVEQALGGSSGEKGIGLAAMHERARMLGGSLTITSQKGAGTCVALKLPAKEEEKCYGYIPDCPGRRSCAVSPGNQKLA